METERTEIMYPSLTVIEGLAFRNILSNDGIVKYIGYVVR